jgi:hypothetical protein
MTFSSFLWEKEKRPLSLFGEKGNVLSYLILAKTFYDVLATYSHE